MSYTAKKGDILFSYGKSFIADLIEDFTNEGASHCAVISDDITKVIESQGFRRIGYCDISYYASNIKIYRLPNSQRKIDMGIRWLKMQIGKLYDYWSIFVICVKLIFKLQLPFKDGKKFICSRLARGYVLNSGFDIPDTVETPRDLEDWIVTNGGVLIFDDVSKKK
jgi:hypothetical protein